jgi:Ca2+-binding RTX toxin-like protein
MRNTFRTIVRSARRLSGTIQRSAAAAASGDARLAAAVVNGSGLAIDPTAAVRAVKSPSCPISLTLTMSFFLVAFGPSAHAALGNITMDFAAGGILTLTSPSDPIVLACLGGSVAVNGEVPVEVPAVPCANVVRVSVQGGAGDNTFTLAAMLPADFTSLTQVDIDGGAGNDTITGSFLADTLHGGSGNDSLDGSDNPPGTTDAVFGDDDDDTMTWNPGKDDDVNEGGNGNDVSVIVGGGGAEVFLIGAVGNRVRFERTTNNGDPAAFFVNIADTETLRVNGNGGNDTITGGVGLATLIALELNGGVGNDTINGGDGADVLHGNADNDTLDGGDNPPGTLDRMFGDEDNDTLIWNPGKDDDLHEGGLGIDVSVINGGGGAEVFSITPNGARVLFQRSTNNGDPSRFFVDIAGSETLRVNGNAGDDDIVAGTGLATLIALELNGGDGNDDIIGGDGADLLHGDAGNDTLRAGENPAAKADRVFGDGGDDLMLWNAGEDDDTNEGGPGRDTTLVSAAGADETFSIEAAGERVLLRRDLPSVFTVDSGSIEVLALNTAGGDDVTNTQLLFGVEQALDGGASGSPQGDKLNVVGFEGDASFSPILTPRFGAVLHGNFESVQGIASGGSATSLLDGSQEVPPVDSLGSGRGLVVLSADESQIRVRLGFADLGGNSTLAHIHGPAAAGANAPPIFDLTGTGAPSGDLGELSFDVTPEQVADLKAGLWYFNVHSTSAGSGEIRGQILPDHLLRGPLEARQVVSGSTSTARGYGTATLAGAGDVATITLAFSSLTGENGLGVNTANRVHGPAGRGVEGTPIETIELPASGSDAGAFVQDYLITPTQAAQLRDGQWYLQVESQEFPSGELRGQLVESLFFDNFE